MIAAPAGAGQWAERAGILAGDELLSVNGRNVSDMAPEEFLQLVESSRPLAVVMGRWGENATSSGPGAFSLAGNPNCTVSQCTAASGDSDLGLSFAIGSPSKRGSINETVPGLWAAKNSLLVGDVLTSIDGRNVTDMNQMDFIWLLKKRPLSLGFSRCDPIPLPPMVPLGTKVTYMSKASLVDEQLGFVPIMTDDGTFLVASLVPGLWAEKNNVKVGHELLAINNKPVKGMSPTEMMKQLQTRPMYLTLAEGDKKNVPAPLEALSAPASADCILFPAYATFADGNLGLYTALVPPTTRQVVGVDAGRWAARSKMAVGDVLLTVNGFDITKMTQLQFIKVMEGTRPLAITFGRCSPIISKKEPMVAALATPADTKLGFMPVLRKTGEPVYVAIVEDSMWASKAGMTPGDEVLTLNSKNASSMSPEDLRKLISDTRPLAVVFKKGKGNTGKKPSLNGTNTYLLTATVGDPTLGFVPAAMPPEPVRVVAVEPGGWADVNKVHLADELIAVNGAPVATMTAEELLGILRQTRPLLMLFKRGTDTIAALLNNSVSLPSAAPKPPNNPNWVFTTQAPDQVGEVFLNSAQGQRCVLLLFVVLASLQRIW